MPLFSISDIVEIFNDLKVGLHHWQFRVYILMIFYKQAPNGILLDVRSPGEFLHAHIPGAVSLPLFTDEERKIVGTAYKQESREIAIKIGLKFFGVKTVAMIETVEALAKSKNGKTTPIYLHCWRGGMRSAAVAWLLDLYGFKVYTLKGGYKTFRNWCLDHFTKEYHFKILGGFTGSGKTSILQELKKQNEIVIDLEKIACHRGSAFGKLGQPVQPSQEMFENLFAIELSKASSKNQNNKCIWLEDESQRIGNINIPSTIYQYIKTQPVAFINIPFEERLKRIVEEYGVFEKEKLSDCIERISKRLGGLETKNALTFLEEHDIESCFRILLTYYDRWYDKSVKLRPEWKSLVTIIDAPTTDAEANAQLLVTVNSKADYVN
jgi:tRNA 2-selenouridine synthase